MMPPKWEGRPTSGAALKSAAKTTNHSVSPAKAARLTKRQQGTVKANVDAVLAEYVEHFRHRVIQDALTEATAAYWLRRADTFAAVGNVRCDEIAQACRARAAVSLLQGDDAEPELLDVLGEVR